MKLNEIKQRDLKRRYRPGGEHLPGAVLLCWKCQTHLSQGSLLCDYCRRSAFEALCRQTAAAR